MACSHQSSTRRPSCGGLCSNVLEALVCSPEVLNYTYNEYSSSATLYGLAKRLGYILSLPLTLHHSLSPTLRRIAPDDPDVQIYDNIPPELALVATAIVVLKLVYGLDGKLR